MFPALFFKKKFALTVGIGDDQIIVLMYLIRLLSVWDWLVRLIPGSFPETSGR